MSGSVSPSITPLSKINPSSFDFGAIYTSLPHYRKKCDEVAKKLNALEKNHLGEENLHEYFMIYSEAVKFFEQMIEQSQKKTIINQIFFDKVKLKNETNKTGKCQLNIKQHND